MKGFLLILLDPTLDNLQYASGIAAIFATLVVVAGLVFEYAGSDATARSNWSPLTGPPSIGMPSESVNGL
jgi:hypothetical protein